MALIIFKMIRPYAVVLILALAPFTGLTQNINLSQENVFDGEPYLAINPNNEQHLVVAWMGYVPLAQVSIKTKVSFDGGQTWSSTTSIPHTNPLFGSADPSLVFNSTGDVFLTYIDFQALIDSGAVYVRKSVDGGLNWEDPVTALHMHSDGDQHPLDRPWTEIDNSGGVNDGNIYVTSMPPLTIGFIPPPYHPYLVRSNDEGSSFEPFRYIDTTGYLVGSFIPGPMPSPTVGPDGRLHIVYPSWELTQALIPQMIMASSANGGLGFEYSTVYASAQAFSDTLAKKAYLLRADPSDPDHIAFLHLDITHGDADVYLRETFDSGENWSAGIRINDDPAGNNRMQDLVWADFDSDGDLVVAWRDRRNGSDSTYTTSTEIWGALRPKDSTQFSPNFLISDALVAHDSILEGAGNDFLNIQLENDTISVVWGDIRNGSLNIYFQRMSSDGVINSTTKLNSEVLPKVKVFPNPATDVINIDGDDIIGVRIYNANGQEVPGNLFNLVNLSRLDLSKIAQGTYLIAIETASGSVTRNVVIE